MAVRRVCLPSRQLCGRVSQARARRRGAAARRAVGALGGRHMTDDFDGARNELRRLLDGLALPPATIARLVAQAELTYPGRRAPLLVGGQPTEHERLVVRGIVR